ncbi:hypothetical protein PY254_17380 [Rhodanobacter sp. AS-Z3]|uniref:hypothetical protein n=1 Tax=Rhodanobacter sp. AS-Z3 TaxID=3031330 RepID=UPI0024786F15|nr:hypothetical protein [Rhodanobacter sp. AS-Z3]WEN14978.1 hypothetical protein PY254_17380 [Rhodanobacter sp. AS-Z3]
MKTTLHSVLCVAIRLGAVLMVVGNLEQIPGLVFYSSEEGHLVWAALSLHGAGLLLAFALWFWPNLLAWWAVSRSQGEVLELAISPAQLQYVALSVAGVWAFIGGLSGVVGHGAVIVLIKHQASVGDSSAFVPAAEWRAMVYYGTMLLAGAALAFGARGLAGLLQSMRGYPHAKTAVAANNNDFAQDG